MTASSLAAAAPSVRRPFTVAMWALGAGTLLCSIDRVAFPMLIQPIGKEFGLSDTQSGLLTGFAFSAMYALAAIPVARWADVGNRRTIVALAMAVWSVMTALCGLAHSVWQLFAGRFGVGFGEAGSGAPMQSLIADYYPPEARPLPMSLLGLGGAIGGILGYAIVGALAERYGWRSALVVLSLPGLVVAALMARFVVEPRQAPVAADARVSFRAALAGMLRKRAFVHITVGFAIWGVASSGIGAWLPTFMLRAHSLSMTNTGLMLALVMTAIVFGLPLGGLLGNRMLARDLRWGLWLPVIGMTTYSVLSIGALLAPSLPLALALLAISAGVAGLIVGPLIAVLAGLVRADARAVSLAVIGLLGAGLGGSLGPLTVGALSDALHTAFGDQSLRYALALTTLPLFWGVLHLLLASRHLLAEFEDERGTHAALPASARMAEAPR